jgi:hypothetical protein
MEFHGAYRRHELNTKTLFLVKRGGFLWFLGRLKCQLFPSSICEKLSGISPSETLPETLKGNL